MNDASTSGDVYTSAVGSNSNAGTSSAPFLTLRKAIDQCGCGGTTIYVDAGTYTDDDLVVSTVATVGSPMVIQGASKTLTIFDGDAASNGLGERFMSITTNASYVTVSDMTIQDMGGTGFTSNGAGMNVTTSGTVTLQDIHFKNCDLVAISTGGGGLHMTGSGTTTVDRCTFSLNNEHTSSSSGASIYVVNGTRTIQNCLFYDNATYENYSGNVWLEAGTNKVYNCTFTENTASGASYTGEIYCNGGTNTITNDIIWNNTSIYCVRTSSGTNTLSYLLYDDDPETAGTNSLNDQNPLFLDAANNNFSISSTSPAKNSGTNTNMPSVDILENIRDGSYDRGCYEYMPIYYWVGGTGNWSQYATHWANSSGGTSYKSAAPTSGDYVIFDANSGGGTCTIDAAAIANDMTMTGYTGTIAGSASIDIHGSLVVGSGSSWSHSGTTSFKSTSTGKTITSNGKTLSCSLNFNGSGGAWTLQDALTTTASITLTAGTLIPGSNTIKLAGNWANNGGTFTAGTGTVEFNGNNSLQTASGSGATAFYNVIVNKGSNASNILEANGVGALSNSGNITITNGVFKMTTGTWQFNATPTIPSAGGLIVNGATLNSGNFSYTNNGLIRVLSGIAAFGTASGNDLTNSNAALFDVQGGTVSFSGRLYNSANGTAPTGYSSTGVSISGTPTITICSVGNNSASLASFHMTTTSNLSFTGGTVILQNPNTNGTPFNDIEILSGGTKSISGGTFQIGNASTAAAKTFIVNSAIPLYNFTVNATNSPKVNLVTSNLTVSSTLAMSGGDVTMSTDATVLGTLTLSAGKLVVAGGKTLSIGNNSTNGTISGGSSSSYIVAYKDLTTAATGTLKRFVNLAAATSYNLPIGDATSYTPMTFLLNSATLSSAYISVFTKAAKIATMNASVTNYLNRYWDLTPSGITGTVNYRVDYTYATGDIVGSTTNFFPVKRSGTTTYTWYKPTGTSFSTGTAQGSGSVVTGTNTLTWSGLSTFSEFSAAGNQVVNLPIDLLSFDAKKQNQNNLLFWSTATETNSDYFTVEKTIDGASYEVVGNVNGGGTSFDQLNYSLVDYDVRKAINYYRLKQTDTDGAEKISALVSVDNRENLGKVISMKTNLLGQEINENYRGVVIVIFEDGTSIKIIQ